MRKLFLILIIGLSILSCKMKYYKKYDYHPAKVEQAWGTVHGKFLGKVHGCERKAVQFGYFSEDLPCNHVPCWLFVDKGKYVGIVCFLYKALSCSGEGLYCDNHVLFKNKAAVILVVWDRGLCMNLVSFQAVA